MILVKHETAVYYCEEHDQFELGYFKSCWTAIYLGEL